VLLADNPYQIAHERGLFIYPLENGSYGGVAKSMVFGAPAGKNLTQVETGGFVGITRGLEYFYASAGRWIGMGGVNLSDASKVGGGSTTGGSGTGGMTTGGGTGQPPSGGSAAGESTAGNGTGQT